MDGNKNRWDDERRGKWRGDAKRNDKDWRRCVDNELGDCDYKEREKYVDNIPFLCNHLQ